jgi:glycosyltransferase involved in cell wall biosynthesis
MTNMPKKISFMVTQLVRAGAEKQLVQLAMALRERGWQVSVMSLLAPLAYAEELEQKGIAVASLHIVRGSDVLWAAPKAIGLLKKWQPSLLCTFNYHADMLGRIGARFAGVPVVTSSIRNENFGGPVRDRLIRLTNGLAPMTTTNSERAAKALVARGVVRADKLKVIGNGIVMQDYAHNGAARERIRKELSLGDSFVWFTAGRLEPQKDQSSLLKAFSQLSGDQRLLLAGEGDLRQALSQEAIDLAIDQRVQFLGVRSDIPALLSAADAFVLSSAWEGLPNVVMEALAAGLPAVTTDVGGARELVSEGKSGFLVPAQQVAKLAEAMKRLSSLPAETRQTMGAAGQAHIAANYGLEAVINQWEQFFLGLLARA